MIYPIYIPQCEGCVDWWAANVCVVIGFAAVALVIWFLISYIFF